MNEHICSKSGLPMDYWTIGPCPGCHAEAQAAAEGPSAPLPSLADGLEAEPFAEPQLLADASLGAALRAALATVRGEGYDLLISPHDGCVWVFGPALSLVENDATRALASALSERQP